MFANHKKQILFFLLLAIPVWLVIGFFVFPRAFAQVTYGTDNSGYLQSASTTATHIQVAFTPFYTCTGTQGAIEFRFWNGTSWNNIGGGIAGCNTGNNEWWSYFRNIDRSSGDGTYGIFWIIDSSDIINAQHFMLLELSGTDVSYTTFNSNTRIVSQTPANLSVTGSTNVSFSIDYVSGSPTANQICIELQNFTTYSTLTPICETVNQSGYLTYATTSTFSSGHLIGYRAVLKNNNGDYIDTGPAYSFSVQTAQQSTYTGTGTTTFGVPTTTFFSDVTLECDPDDPFFERSICNVMVMLFSPAPNSVNNFYSSLNNLGTKLPFSVIAEVYDSWRLLETQNNQEWATTTVVANLGGSDFEIFSFGESSVKQFTGEQTWNTFMDIMEMILWTIAGLYMFNRTLRIYKS